MVSAVARGLFWSMRRASDWMQSPIVSLMDRARYLVPEEELLRERGIAAWSARNWILSRRSPADLTADKPLATDENARQDLLTKLLKGRTFTAREARSLALQQMEGEVDERTIRRDLSNIGAATVKKGLWSLK